MKRNPQFAFFVLFCIFGRLCVVGQEIPKHTLGLRFSGHSGSGVFYQRILSPVLQARATAGGWWKPVIENVADVDEHQSVLTAGADIQYTFAELPKLRMYAGIGVEYLYEYERDGCGFCPYDQKKPEWIRTETDTYLLKIGPFLGTDFIIAGHLTITSEISYCARFQQSKAVSYYTLETSPRIIEDHSFGYNEFAPSCGIGLGYRW